MLILIFSSVVFSSVAFYSVAMGKVMKKKLDTLLLVVLIGLASLVLLRVFDKVRLP